VMGNVTSDLIETAIKSENSDSDRYSPHENITTSDSSKLELYRLLTERMEGTDSHHKNTPSVSESISSSSSTSVVQVPPKDHMMMAPKKKFLIGYRGSEDEHTSENTGAGNPSVVDVAKVSSASSSTSADVARSRSHTVSLPFRTRGPPQSQSELPRRPLVDSKVEETVSTAVTIRSCIMTAIDSRVGMPPTCTLPQTPQPDMFVGRPKPHSTAVELASPIQQSVSVSRDVRPSLGANVGVDKYQQHQRLTSGVSAVLSSHSPRSGQHYHRDSAGITEGSGTSRPMPHPSQYVRDRPNTLSEPVSRMAELGARHIAEPHNITDIPVTTHPGMDCQVDRRFLPPGGADRPPPPTVDRRFTVPAEYWKETTAGDRRKVSHEISDHRELRSAIAVGHDTYMSQMPMPPSQCVDPHNRVNERHVTGSLYVPPDLHTMPPDQTTGSYPSRSVDLARARAGQHQSADSYRHSSSIVELSARDFRAGRPHYHDMGDMSQHMRKYPPHEVRMSTADYSTPVVMPDVQYKRHQLREPMIVQSGVGVGPEAEHQCHRPEPHPIPLQPVEPSVRPRIAGLTHGDPAVCEPHLSQIDSSRYSAEHMHRSRRYELVEWPRPVSDVLTPFIPSDQKQVRRRSPYQSLPGSTWSSSGTSGLTAGSGTGSFRGEPLPRVTSESPLDLTVRKEQLMSEETFLRRCHEASRHSSHYPSPGGHAAELQYSSLPSRQWTMTSSGGFEPSVDVRQRTADVIPMESLYPGHVAVRTGDAVCPMHSAVRECPPHLETDVRRLQHHRRSDEDDVHTLYSRRDAEPRWDSTRQPVPSMTSSPIVRPAYWDGRHVAQPVQMNTEMTEGVADSQIHRSTMSYAGDVGWVGDRSQYGARLVKPTNPEIAAASIDRRSEVPLALSPQNVATAAASRRIPMVQLLGGKYSPSDILHLCCKVCGSTYGSLRSFRMHFAKAHGQEPTPENFTIQTISDARIQAMSQRAQETTQASHSPLKVASSEAAASGVSHEVDIDQHKRPIGVCEFSTNALTKPRSVAEVQPMQKKSSPMVVDESPPTPVSKPSPDEATKRTGEDRRMKCKKCGEFLTQDLSTLRQHVRSHGDTLAHWSSIMCSCECNDAVDSETGCAVCLEGFNDVSDWQHHVTSQHMMRSCICKSCDVGFTNASALRRHLTATHGIESPTGSNVEVEYRCLFCREAFTDEHSLYTHTRAHEQHYSTQRKCSHAHHASRGSTPIRVQMAVPDTTCPEDHRLSVADVTSLDAAPASCTMESDTAAKSIELETAKKSIDITEHSDVTVQKSPATFDVRLNSKKASILRRLSAGLSHCLFLCYCVFMCVSVCCMTLTVCVCATQLLDHLYHHHHHHTYFAIN